MKRNTKIIIATTAFVVLGGIATPFVLADSAKPGDLLFGLDKAMEGFALNNETTIDKKIETAIKIADERKGELEALKGAEPEKIELGLTELKDAVVKAQDDLTNLKVENELGATDVATDRIEALDDQLGTVLGATDKLASELETEVADTTTKGKVADLKAEVTDQIAAGAAKKIHLRGEITKSDGKFKIKAGKQDIEIKTVMPLDVFSGKNVKLEGDLGGGAFNAKKLDIGAVEAEVDSGKTRIKVTSAVQKKGNEFEASAEGITFKLSGTLNDELGKVVGRESEIRGTLDGSTVRLQKVKTRDDKATVELKNTASDDNFKFESEVRQSSSLTDDKGATSGSDSSSDDINDDKGGSSSGSDDSSEAADDNGGTSGNDSSSDANDDKGGDSDSSSNKGSDSED